MTGRKKIADGEKSVSITIALKPEEIATIEKDGVGNSFSQKIKSLIWGKGMENEKLYTAGLAVGKFQGAKARTAMLQITDPEITNRQFKFNKIVELCVTAQQEIPPVLLKYLGGSDDADELSGYYSFITGVCNGML